MYPAIWHDFRRRPSAGRQQDEACRTQLRGRVCHVESQLMEPTGTENHWLVGGDWNMTGLFFHSVGNVIIPIDFHIFQRGWNHQPAERFQNITEHGDVRRQLGENLESAWIRHVELWAASNPATMRLCLSLGGRPQSAAKRWPERLQRRPRLFGVAVVGRYGKRMKPFEIIWKLWENDGTWWRANLASMIDQFQINDSVMDYEPLWITILHTYCTNLHVSKIWRFPWWSTGHRLREPKRQGLGPAKGWDGDDLIWIHLVCPPAS